MVAPVERQLAHPLFSAPDKPLFGEEPDGTPVLVVRLGEREVALCDVSGTQPAWRLLLRSGFACDA